MVGKVGDERGDGPHHIISQAAVQRVGGLLLHSHTSIMHVTSLFVTQYGIEVNNNAPTYPSTDTNLVVIPDLYCY